MAELVGLNSRPPDAFGKIGQLLNLRQQQTALAGAQQTQRQRAALASYDFSQHMADDGTLDLNSVATDPGLRQAAGDQYLEVLAHAATAKQMQLEAKSKLFSLRGDQVQALGQTLAPLLQDPDVVQDNQKGRQKLNQAWMQYGQLYGDEALPVLQTFAAPLRDVPQGKLPGALRMIQLQALDVERQRQAMLPEYANQGRTLRNINPNAAADSPQSLGLSLPPNATLVQSPVTGAQGVTDLARPDRVVPVGTAPGAGAPAPTAPAGSWFQQPTYQGQANDVQHAQEEVRQVRSVADNAPTQRNIFQNILKLSKDTNTGPLRKYLAETKFGGVTGTSSDDFQILNKYLEKNAISAMSAMGAPSDSRLEAAVAANGSTAFNPKALQEVTKFNYAANTGLEMYRAGIDRAVGTRTPNYLALPEFKSQWAQNFDLEALRLENAVRDGDEDEKKRILSTLTKEQKLELAQKLRNLESLSKTGKLPQ